MMDIRATDAIDEVTNNLIKLNLTLFNGFSEG